MDKRSRVHRTITDGRTGVHRITISPEEASVMYDIPIGTLANLRSRKQGAPFYKVNGSRKVLYKVTEFEAWIYSQKIRTIDSEG